VSSRFRFVTEFLAYQAGAAGKDAATLERDFDAVAAAARGYLDTSRRRPPLREVARVFGGGWERYDEQQYLSLFAKKAPLFAQVFGQDDRGRAQCDPRQRRRLGTRITGCRA